MNDDPTLELPCGCRLFKVDNVLMYEPCSTDCGYYDIVLKRAEERNIPTTTLEV